MLNGLFGRREASEEKTLHVLIFREGDWWVAQYLEHDIAAQAKSLDDLSYELQRVLVGTMVANLQNGLPGLGRLPRAPERYWKAFDRARLQVQPRDPQFRFPPGTPMHKLPVITGRLIEAGL